MNTSFLAFYNDRPIKNRSGTWPKIHNSDWERTEPEHITNLGILYPQIPEQIPRYFSQWWTFPYSLSIFSHCNSCIFRHHNDPPIYLKITFQLSNVPTFKRSSRLSFSFSTLSSSGLEIGPISGWMVTVRHLQL